MRDRNISSLVIAAILAAAQSEYSHSRPTPRLIPRDKAPTPPPPDTNYDRIMGRAHQGEAEKARRRRQMERAARKQK